MASPRDCRAACKFMIRPYALQPHPLSPDYIWRTAASGVPWQVSVAVQGTAQALLLEYDLRAPPGGITLPPCSAVPQRSDQLWRHSCCELFIALPNEPAYLEFNFSPSGNWAAYIFDAPRQGMRAHHWQGAEPSIHMADLARVPEGVTRLCVTLPWEALSAQHTRAAQIWAAGLCVVLSTLEGTQSFWALQHLSAQPDFHDRGGFAATLEVPE